jgi:hypothetical protein
MTTNGTEVDRVIVTIDLRDIDPATVLSQPFYEVQAKQGPVGNGQQADFGRVILVDRAGQLMAHDEIYAHVLDSHIDVSILCVAVGPPPAEDPTIAVRRPLQLGPPKAAVLWVGDLDGIGWRMDSSLASQVNLPVNGIVPDPARLPGELLEVLSVPQVFDEVLTLVSAMPGTAASPGMRITRGDIPADILTIAQRAAIKQLTKEPGGVTDLPPLGKLEGLLSPSGQRPGRATETIRPGGRVDDLTQQGRRASRAAMALTRRVTGLGGFAGPHAAVRGALSSFAKALDELREVAAWALDEVDTLSGFDARHRQDLTDLGIDLTELPAGTLEHVTATRTEQVLEVVAKGQSLPAVARRLRDDADCVAPQGTEHYRSRLPSDGLVKALRTPPPFIAGVPPVPMLVTAFLTCLIGGAWPQPFGLYAGLTAVGAILIGVWLLSRGTTVSPGSGAAAGWFLGAHTAASVLGAGCGVAVSGAVTSTSLPAGLGAVVTIVMLMILTLASWRVLASRWAEGVQVAKAAKAPEAIRQLLADVAREEWELAGAKTSISDHCRVLGGMIDDAAVTLRGQEARLSALGTPAAAPGGTARRAAHDQVSQELVAIDLAAGTTSALGRLIAAPGPGGLATVDSQMVQHEVIAMLDEYRVHLLTASLHEPPPFGRPSERRAELVQSLVDRGSDLQNAIRYPVTSERITQLCAPHQLTLLETRPDKAELIRFAPHSAQGFIDQRTTGRERPVNWIWASAIAGVLRLVQLRPGAVEEVISTGGSSSPSGAGQP